MMMIRTGIRTGVIAAALAAICLLWSGWDTPASAQTEIVTARIVVQAVSPEALDLCLDLGDPAERLCPWQRRFPHSTVPHDRWFQSEQMQIAAGSTVRIRVRRIQDDRIEFGLLLETPRERSLLHPDQRFLTPSRLPVNRWARSSPVLLTLPAPAEPIVVIPGQGVPAGAPALELGYLATNFSLPDLREEAQLIEFNDYRTRVPNGVTVLVFWSSWSPNDAAALQALDQIQREQENVRVLGINIADEAADALALVDELGLEFTNVRDTTGGVAIHYRVGGLPELYFIDARGIYRETVQGAAPIEMIEDAIKRTAAAP